MLEQDRPCTLIVIRDTVESPSRMAGVESVESVESRTIHVPVCSQGEQISEACCLCAPPVNYDPCLQSLPRCCSLEGECAICNDNDM